MIPSELNVYDFRNNLIVDVDNPVLIQKAWRDHYEGRLDTGDNGKAYLGAPHGEDALTWNLFRSLQAAGTSGLHLICEVFGLTPPVETILFWGCEVDGGTDNQQLLNILIRTIDGQLRGTMTEPDLVIITTKEVAFVECKLNPGFEKQSPWQARIDAGEIAGKKLTGAERRMSVYQSVHPVLKECGSFAEWKDLYQIIRQYVYAKALAGHLQRKHCVIPLVHGADFPVLKPLYESVQQLVRSDLEVFRSICTWQDFAQALEDSQVPMRESIIAKVRDSLDASIRKCRRD